MIPLFLFLLFTTTISTPVQCTDDANLLSVLSIPIKDCHNVNTCRVNCKPINNKNYIFHLKLNLDNQKISKSIKNAFSETCAWYLERREILTDIELTKPQGRGQLISQFIIHLARKFRNSLPLPINPVKDTIKHTRQTMKRRKIKNVKIAKRNNPKRIKNTIIKINIDYFLPIRMKIAKDNIKFRNLLSLSSKKCSKDDLKKLKSIQQNNIKKGLFKQNDNDKKDCKGLLKTR